MTQAYCIALLLLITGCATSTPQLKEIKNLKNKLVKKSIIKNVPYVRQKNAFCGPSTLSMVMQYHGKKITQQDLSKITFIKGAQGTFQIDMISAPRRNGFLSIPTSGLVNLFKEIENGNPVIVFKNLGFDWYPLWHYAVVYGYDLKENVVYLHTGEDKSKKQKLAHFKRNWKRGNYWGLIVLPPGKLSQSGTEIDHMRSSAALEENKFLTEAELSYISILNKWPTSYMANIGLGNIYFKQRKFPKALRHFEEARKINPDKKIAQKNISILKDVMRH